MIKKAQFNVFVLLTFLSLWVPEAFGANIAYQVKASYIYNFLQFVTFPANTINGKLNVCILGENYFGNALSQIEGAKTPQASLHIIYLGDFSNNTSLHSCHVVYITQSEKDNTQSILARINTQKIFTIAEYSPFIAYGGLIELFIQDDKIRFRINHDLVQNANFHVSSQLLQLGAS